MESPHRKHPKTRQERIAEAAYFRAERRAFQGGDPVADWIEAEREIDAEGAGGHLGLIEKLEAQIETAQKKLKSLSRRAADLKDEARARREHDLERLQKLKETLEKRLAELRSQGEHASQQLKQRGEQAWTELAELIHELGTRKRSSGKK